MTFAHRPRTRRRLLQLLLAPALAASVSACGSGISLEEPIEGPVWRLVQLGGQPPLVADTDAQRAPHLRFDAASGRVSGSGGCNRIFGSYSIGAGKLLISQLAATKMACAEPQRSRTESDFLGALQATTAYRLAGPGQLVLLDAGGRTLALLQTAPRG